MFTVQSKLTAFGDNSCIGILLIKRMIGMRICMVGGHDHYIHGCRTQRAAMGTRALGTRAFGSLCSQQFVLKHEKYARI